MGFLDKIKNGLARTKRSMTVSMNNMFASFTGENEEFFDELEETMILADAGADTAVESVEELRRVVKARGLRGGEEVKSAFAEILADRLNVGERELHLTTKPSVILMVGVNGVGKTTTIGKLAARFMAEGKSVLLAAGDTFRAAAIEQLEIWAERAGADIVKHTQGADPAAVVFDSIAAAKARGADVVICDTAGKIIWRNRAFGEATEAIGSVMGVGLDTISTLSLDALSEDAQSDAELCDRLYRVDAFGFKTDEKNYWFLVFNDRTEYEKLTEMVESERSVIAYILIDNLDELSRHVQDFGSEVNDIAGILRDFAAELDAVLREYERNKYLLITNRAGLNRCIASSFSILDRVREVRIGDMGLPVTISMGISDVGATLRDREAGAREALGMALARGGDQVVYKNDDGLRFYGGTTRPVQKRSSVAAKVRSCELVAHISRASSVLIMGHSGADQDCFGAAVGIARTALAAQKKVGIVYDPNSSLANALYERLLNESSDMKQAFVTPEQALIMASPTSVTVVVDTHRASMTAMPKLLEFSERVVVIDHHRKSADFIENAEIFFHEPYASSASEMVAEIMQYMNVNRMPAVEAEALMAGIYLDTKNFMIRTSLHTFEASSYLRKAGANTVNVKKLFQVDMQTYMQKTDMVQNAKVYRKIVAIACWEDKAGSQFRIASAQAADEMLNIEGVQASFTLFPDSTGAVIISGRSFGQVNVQLITEKLGGGGHQTMAGAQIKNSTPKEALDMLKKAIDEYIEESNILGTHS